MGTISHISADGPILGCSNAMLRNIADEAILRTQNESFLEALKNIEFYGDIDLYQFPDDCKLAFAEAAAEVAGSVELKSDEFPEYVARLRWIAEEVRKMCQKESL